METVLRRLCAFPRGRKPSVLLLWGTGRTAEGGADGEEREREMGSGRRGWGGAVRGGGSQVHHDIAKASAAPTAEESCSSKALLASGQQITPIRDQARGKGILTIQSIGTREAPHCRRHPASSDSPAPGRTRCHLERLPAFVKPSPLARWAAAACAAATARCSAYCA
jgi:hypothetical protein